MNSEQVNFKILWKVVPKNLTLIGISIFCFAILNFSLSLFGIFLFQEPIQQIIFYVIFIGGFCCSIVKDYNELMRKSMSSKPKVTINIVWSKADRRYNVNIPELNAVTYGDDLQEAFANAEVLIKSLTGK